MTDGRMTDGHIVVIAREGALLIRDNLLGRQEAGTGVLLTIVKRHHHHHLPETFPRARTLLLLELEMEVETVFYSKTFIIIARFWCENLRL
jgi:hypothetical protein